jgi:uncharacterized membrane protein
MPGNLRVFRLIIASAFVTRSVTETDARNVMTGNGQGKWQLSKTTETVINQVQICVLSFAQNKDAHYLSIRADLMMLRAFFKTLAAKRMI